jgi:hypothetical protein
VDGLTVTVTGLIPNGDVQEVEVQGGAKPVLAQFHPVDPSRITSETFSAEVPLLPGVNHLREIARRMISPPACYSEGDFEVESLACDPSLNGPSNGPTPEAQTIFNLVDPSSVTLPDGSTEPLQGTILVSQCLSPNTYFAARIEMLQLASASVAIKSGCADVGYVVASTLYLEMPTTFLSAVWIKTET